MSPPLPSPAATWLLECVLPPRNRDAVIGDLAEEYWLRLQSQPRVAANQWYWAQVLKSVPKLAVTAFTAGKWYLTIGIALAVFVVVSLLEAGINFLVSAVLPFGPDVIMGVSMIVGLASIALGGYVAAWIRPAATLALAAVQGIMVLTFIVTAGDAFPLWFNITFLILCPAATLAGGILYIRKGRRGRPAG